MGARRRYRAKALLWALGLPACTVARGLVDELPPPGFSVLDIGCPLRPACPFPDGTQDYVLGPGVPQIPGYLFDAAALSLFPYCGMEPRGPCPEISLQQVLEPGGAADGGVVRIAAAESAAVQIRAATLTDVTIELYGAVELRISRGSILQRVDIRSVDADPGARVTIEDSQLSVVSIELSGRLSLDRAQLMHARLRASDASLTSVEGSQVDLDAQHLNASAARILQGTLALESGTLTLSQLDLVRLTRCGTLSLLASQVMNSRLGACSAGDLHVESSRVAVSDLEGPIASRGSAWSQVRFGIADYTSMAAEGSSITDSTLCPSMGELRLGLGNSLACVACLESESSSLAACLVLAPERETQILQSSCAGLADIPACTNVPDAGLFGIPDGGLDLWDAGALAR